VAGRAIPERIRRHHVIDTWQEWTEFSGVSLAPYCHHCIRKTFLDWRHERRREYQVAEIIEANDQNALRPHALPLLSGVRNF
jgi:hypothetical protein